MGVMYGDDKIMSLTTLQLNVFRRMSESARTKVAVVGNLKTQLDLDWSEGMKMLKNFVTSLK